MPGTTGDRHGQTIDDAEEGSNSVNLHQLPQANIKVTPSGPGVPRIGVQELRRRSR